MCLPSGLGYPRAWIGCLLLIWTWAPQTGVVLSSSDHRLPQQAVLASGWRHSELLLRLLSLGLSQALCLGSLTSQPCDTKAFFLSRQPRAYAGLTSSHPHLRHPPTPPHRSVKEPAWTRGSSGTSPREQPSFGCPTQRGPWKVGGALSSTLDWPISTDSPSAQGLPSPLDAPADLWS